MEKITIIGAGVSGLALIENIKKLNIGCQIRLIDKNEFFIPKKSLLNNPIDIQKRIDLAQWAKEKKVEFINLKVERISTKRNKIYCKTGEIFEFEKLVVATGLVSKKLPIKGEHRDGFFYFSKIDPFSLRELIKMSKEATVYASTWLGIKLAAVLLSFNQEVRLVTKDLDFLGPYKERVINFLKEKNISLHQGYDIEEIVGEANVKAVKLTPLKVFSSQLVFADCGFTPGIDFFEDEVILRNTFFSNFENIYFLGDVNEKDIENEVHFIYNHNNALKQADAFSNFLSSQEEPIFKKEERKDGDVEECYSSIMSKSVEPQDVSQPKEVDDNSIQADEQENVEDAVSKEPQVSSETS
jgi:thioredoxin reductase